MEQLHNVTLIGPAKVGGVRRSVGAVVAVTEVERRHLAEAGAISPQEATAARSVSTRLYTEDEFQAKLTEILAKSDERLGAAFAVELSDLKAQLGAVTARLAELDAVIAVIRNASEILPEQQAGEEAGVDKALSPSGAAPAPEQNTPPTEPAAKTTPKRGAAATSKG